MSPTGAHVRIGKKKFTFIAVWADSIASIPDGWALVATLADRFPMGIRDFDGFLLGDTGGVGSYSVSHLHDWDPIPFHSDNESGHSHSGSFGDSNPGGGGVTGQAGTGPNSETAHTHPVTAATTATEAHNHPVGGHTATDSFSQDNRPPFRCQPYMRGVAEIPINAVAISDQAPSAFVTHTAGPSTTLTDGLAPADYLTFEYITVAADLGRSTPFTVYIGAEEIKVFSLDGAVWRVGRAWNGSTGTAHAAGATVSLPKYAVCSRDNGTPDLRGGFVIGADGASYTLNEYYGTLPLDTITPDTHAHGNGVTVASSDHYHTLFGTSTSFVASSETTYHAGFDGVAHSHNHSIPSTASGSGGSHAHTLATTPEPTSAFSPARFTTTPPYRVFTFVQRVDYGGPTSDSCPVGTVLSTPDVSPPTNWATCDGTGGTLNLTGRCVEGAGGSDAVGVTGGSAALNVPAHGHGVGTSALTSSGSAVHDWAVTLGANSAQTSMADIGFGAAVNMDTEVHAHAATLTAHADAAPGNEHEHSFSGSYDASPGDPETINRLPRVWALNWMQRIA